MGGRAHGGGTGTPGQSVSGLPLPQGVTAPRVGLGTWELRGAACERVVREALELGYRHVDTAEGYGNEEAVGAALAAYERSFVFLVSKVWRAHLRPEDLRASCEGSLRRLGTGYLDLLLVHWPDSSIPFAATLEGFQALQEEGKIRAWGVSNFEPRHLDALGGATPATNQVERHPYFRQDRLLSACAARGIPVSAYTPLAKGLVAKDPVLREIGARHGLTAAQVALRWSVQDGHIVLPKASSRRHLAENLAVLDARLTPGEMNEIGSRPQGARMVDGEWSEFEE